MNQENSTKHSIDRQAREIERASWFARLAFGDWASTPVPVPSETRKSTFHVLP